MRVTSTMAVVELPEERLLLFSPLEMTAERRAAVESVGTVAHIYAPNMFHHLWLGDWADAFPRAVVHAPRALRLKRPDLRIDREHDCDFTGDLSDELDELHIDGFAFEETVLIHRRSGTLIVADLVHNVGRPKDLWSRTYARAMGFYDQVAVSRAIRWMAFTDRAAARKSIERLAGHNFDRLLVGHGAPIPTGARAAVLNAYSWLRPNRGLLPPALPVPKRGSCG